MDPDIESQKLVSGPGLERGGGPLATNLGQTGRPDVNVVASISGMLDKLSFEGSKARRLRTGTRLLVSRDSRLAIDYSTLDTPDLREKGSR
jgi:hypothetical protein